MIHSLRGILCSLVLLLLSLSSKAQCSASAGNDTTICQNKPFVRTATVAPAGATIQWYLQGNSSNTLSTTAAVNTVPPSSGVFFYIIKVSSGTGASACTEFDTVKVTVNPSPRINAGPNQSTCQRGFLSITATVVPSSASLNWYLLGSTTSLGTNASYSVPTTTAGTFDFVVKADSASTCSSFDTVRVVVNPKPVANFTFTSNCGRKYQFNSSTSTAGVGASITNYQWTFSGTGMNNYSSTSNQQNPNNNFPRGSSGQTFNIRLIVTNSFGCKDTVTRNITIGASLTAQLSSSLPSTTIDGDIYFYNCSSTTSAVTFTNNTTGSISTTTYTINWGDGSAIENLTSLTFPTNTGLINHTYSSGVYTLTFTATTGNCLDTVRYIIWNADQPGGGITTPPRKIMCIGSRFPVIIRDIGGNANGTKYIITFNDNTAPVTLTHPLTNDTIWHVFNQPSCSSSTGIATPFEANLYIPNPCGPPTTGQVGPFFVVSPPIPDFTIAPDDTVCVGQTVTITNTGDIGSNITFSGSTATCQPSKAVWSISPSTPATLFQIISGSLGTTNGSNSPSSWSGGSTTFDVVFNTPGIYTVKLKVGNNADPSNQYSCGNDSIIKTICVNPPPTASFTLSPNIGCAPLLVNASGSTNTPTCGVNTYRWTVSYVPTNGCVPNAIDFTYVNGTSATSQSPQFSFISPGVYTIGLQTFSPRDRCSSAVVTQTVTVKGKPVVILNLADNTVCVNEPITPTKTDTCFIDASTTYAWTFPNGTPSTSSNPSPGSITYTNAGTYNIGLTVTNVCGSTPANASVTINPLPTVTGTLSVCIGQNTTLTGTSTATGSGTWTSDNTGIATVSSTGVVTGQTAGTTTISFTDGNGCKKSVTITVNPLPTITGNAAICVGSNLTLTGSATAATINPWVSASTGVATISNTGVVTAVGAGTSIITYTNSNGCKSEVTFTVNPLPTITGDTIICLNNTSQLSGSPTAATSNPWVSSTPAIATVTNGGLVSAQSVGTTIITYTNNNGCVKTRTVIVKPLPVISGSSSICVGSNVSFSATTNPSATTPWTSSNTSVATVSNTGAVVGVAAGQSTITYTNEFGCQATFLVTVSSSPTATISYPSTVCTNQTNQNVTLTGATGGTFSLTPVGTTGLSLNTSTGAINPSTSTAGTYTVNYNIPAGNGCPAVNVVTNVTITNTPSAPTPSGNNACSGNTLQLNTSYTGTGTPVWNWTGPNGFSSSNEDPSITNVSVSASGTYSVTVTINNCTSAPNTVNIVIDSTPPRPRATSNSPLCTDSTLVLQSTLSSTILVSWLWTGPGGFISHQQDTTRSNVVLADSGYYYITATATYASSGLTCPSKRDSVRVIITKTPKITTFSSSNPTQCNTRTGSITIHGLTAGAVYTVHYSNNGVDTILNNVTAVGDSIVIGNLAAGTYTNVYVVSSSGCPSNSVGSFSLVDPNPPAPPSPSSNSPICSGGTLTLSASTTAQGIPTYLWSGPGISTGTTGSIVTITNASTWQAGTYNVSLTINNCRSRDTSLLVVIDSTPPRPRATSNSPLCTDSTLVLQSTISSTIPVSWLWTGPGGFVSHQQDTTRSNVVLADSGYYYVTATATYASSGLSCPSKRDSVRVIITKTPKITTFSSSDPTQCNTRTGSITIHGLTAGAVYTVHYSNNGVDTILNNVTAVGDSIVIGNLAAGTYTNVYVVSSSGCPSNSVGSFSLEDPSPPPAPNTSNGGPICDGESLQLNASTNESGTPTWNWTGPNSFSSVSQNPLINPATLVNAGVYSVTVTINNCTSIPGTTTAIVNPRPLAPVVNSPVVYCQYDVPTALTATALSGHTLNWYPTATGGTASTTAPTPSAANTGAVDYYVSQTTPENCEGPRSLITVIVNPTPVVGNVTTTICSGASFNIIPSGTGADATTVYSWSAPVVTGGVTGGAAANDATSLNGQLSNPTDFIQTATYTITPKTGDCQGNTFTLVVTVNPAPRVIFSQSDQAVCSGGTTTIVQLTSPTPNVNIPWTTSVPAGINGVVPSGANTIPAQTLINNTATPLIVTYAAVAINSGTFSCPGDTSRYFITVNPTPVIHDTAFVICSGQSFSLTPVNNQPYNIVPVNTSYTWQVSNNGSMTGQTDTTNTSSLIIQSSLINTTNTPQTLVYTVIPVSGDAGNCPGDPFTITVTINPAPAFPTMYDTICSGGSFDTIPVNNPPFIVPAGTRYTWSIPTMPSGNGGQTSGGQAQTDQTQIFGTLSNTSYEPLNVVYSVTPSSGNASGSACAGAPFNYIVTVNPLASISNNPSNQSVCNNNATLPVDWTSFTAGSTYSWTLVSSGIVTGFLPAGAGPRLGTMTLINTGVAQDSVVYLVSSTANACAGPAKPYIIYVNPDAKASFIPVKDTACWPFQITSDTLVNNSPQTADSAYLWYVDNVFIGSGYIFPGYTISASDTFVDIKLVTISRYGCVNDSTTHRFYTYNDPKPSFALTYSNPPCGPLTVTFQNQTMNFTPNPIAPFNYHWDFGNGNTSNDQNPLPQIYPANPTFNDTTYFVTLTVSNQCVSRDTTIAVTVKAPPRARFAPAATNVCSNAVLQFNNTSLGIGNTYQWIFGDGSPIVTSNNLLPVQHVYNTGVDTTFFAVLIATNECGVDYDTVAIRVTPSSIRLNWYIVAPTQYGCSPHTVQIVNVSRGATQFEWNFNDPNSPGIYTSGLNSEVIFHTYTTPGIYTINVRALNVCTDTTDLDSVRVIRSPIPNISILNNYSCTNTAVRFDNLTDTATRYLWNFGDPTSGVRDTSTLENPSHFYNTEGVYIVTLTATLNDISGVICSSQKTDTVRIVKPIVQINAPTTGCIKDSIVFIPIVNSVLGLAPITDTIWQINGVPYQTSGSGQPNFVHVFTQPGIYNITLIVGTASGCYDTARTLITVNTIPSITVSNDQRICLGNSVQLLATSNAGNYQWTPLSGLNCYTCPNPIASPTITTPYVVSTMNNFGCKNSDTVLVTVIQPFEITASPSDTICIGESTVLSVSGAYRYIWSPAATLSCISCPNPTANPTITTNYMVVGFDNYSCFTDTAKMSVVVGSYPNVTLPPDQILSTGTLFPIPSQSTNGPIRTYSWSPSQDLSCADCPTPVAYIKKDVCYVLNATNIYGCSGEDTMCIKVFCENGQVFIPNTFTPDNDGINDKFLVRGKGIKSIKHFRVFNRWGEIVFERNDFPPNQPSYGWDGKVRGVLSTPDVYVYTAEVVCENDVMFTYKGNVTVIR